ncbi:glycerol-3-phosphate responsive antiterminator [Marinisporobacter balticus]|uniref:Glycerol uptake operon antiterminator n=1 Tax=Marinisporobacter balticus TaxID=2018667 RepID=A0A4R2K6U6_9FIRM|nr:glycerol-3-phosphate responsive antiterminator [Marinisporobacter balticus]TCO67722.1 glycerol uptake operon antiterminator [Marinisporobacter balticus]
MDHQFYYKVEANPIIAAVNNIEKLDLAIQSPCEIIFLLTGNIFNLKSIIDKVKKAGMDIYIHIDLMEGFSKDTVALKYIYENMQPDGIITTKSSLVKKAKNMNIRAIQRLFILDSLSLDTGINSVYATRPDAIEVMPGIMPKIITKLYEKTKTPIIAGGLINDKEDVIASLKAGAMAISTSKEEIWYM